jgi:hypothetical protein
MQWHADVKCATTPTKLDLVKYTSTGVCTKAALTSTDTAEFYTQTAKAESIDTSKLCDFTFAAFGEADCQNANSTEQDKIDAMYNAKTTPYIVGECYAGGDVNYGIKAKSCAAAGSYEIEIYAKKDCSGSVTYTYKGSETGTANLKCKNA